MSTPNVPKPRILMSTDNLLSKSKCSLYFGRILCRFRAKGGTQNSLLENFATTIDSKRSKAPPRELEPFRRSLKFLQIACGAIKPSIFGFGALTAQHGALATQFQAPQTKVGVTTMSDFSCRELSFQVWLCCRSLLADESSNFPVAPRTVAYATTTNYQNLIVVLRVSSATAAAVPPSPSTQSTRLI